MTEADAYIQRLLESNPLREPLLRDVIRALRLREGSRGLDAGCGVGVQAELLAEAVGASGHVTGLDLSPALLHHAEMLAEAAGLTDRLAFQEGDIRRLPFPDRAFDWVWSADCAGYPVGDLVPVLRELARVARPGGTIAVLGWSSQCLLPGYPLLEARLNATCSALTPYFGGTRPEWHFLRALGAFRDAGLTECQGRTFVADVQAPLSDALRGALVSLFQMLWGEPQPGVAQDDREAYLRLCRLESPECVLHLADYYAFFTYSVFRGRVPERSA